MFLVIGYISFLNESPPDQDSHGERIYLEIWRVYQNFQGGGWKVEAGIKNSNSFV